GSHNILMSEGVEHERARKMLNPVFYLHNLKSMISITADQTVKTIERICTMSNPTSINLQMELTALTLSVITLCAFDKGLETIPNAN
ncbi:unnamed protein product, partial [Rotaria sp. Silwood1]